MSVCTDEGDCWGGGLLTLLGLLSDSSASSYPCEAL
jgi:hypothetical protein